MKLNDSWENMSLVGEFLTRKTVLPCGGLSKYFDDTPYFKFDDKEGINMMSMLFCQYGGGIITAQESGQWHTTFLLEETYRIMERWLLEGYIGVSEEELMNAMNYMAAYGEQNRIGSLNRIDIKVIEQEKQREGKTIESKELEIYKRINQCVVDGQSKYDDTILAWTNYWNMNMEKEYGRGNYSPVRADVVKAMLLVETNMGGEHSKAPDENEILANGERDIMQSLDCRNPVVWNVINDLGNGITIKIVFAEDDRNRFNIADSKEKTLYFRDGGTGEKSYYGNGTWQVVAPLFSAEHDVYYAGNVTPEMSMAIGVAEYCKKLNGAGTNNGISILACEETAVERYNGGGDPLYTYKVNLVLENMGVNTLEKSN